MNFTTYHNLQKPLDTEKYNIDIHNTNADIIDSVLNRLEQKNNSQDSVINNEIKRAIERENEIDDKLSAFPKASAELDGFMSAEDKRTLDAAAQNLKLLTANVGSIHGITSDISETNENIAASVQTVNQLNHNLISTETIIIDANTINSIATGQYFSSGGVWVTYNKYFVQISIRLYFSMPLGVNHTYAFGVPASTPWTGGYHEKITVSGSGKRIILVLNNQNVFSILSSETIPTGDHIREDFFCFRKQI